METVTLAAHARTVHAHLHVAQVWNGHDSHFGDVTPAGGADRNMFHESVDLI